MLDNRKMVLYSYPTFGHIAGQGCWFPVENFSQEEKRLDGRRLRIGGMNMRKMKSLGLGLVFMALVSLLCSANAAWGQDVTASITGTVADPSGAAVVGATVTAKSVERGITYTAVTNDSGIYRIAQLPVGSYELKAEKTGFASVAYPAFVLTLNQVARIDVALKVGQVTQIVEVTGAAPVLKTEATQVDTIINSATNDNLPLASRNYVQLTLLAPGTVSTDPSSFNNGNNTGGYGGRPLINGNREQANNFLLDGMDNNQVSDNLLGYTPTPDAIQEFNLITNNASAEFGNFQGGVVNATIKSGTNNFHGDVWEFFRNDKLNANSWENNFSGSPKNKVRWNMFGGTVGGPVLKNKLFFFADYQGQRFDHPTNTQNFTVMTAAERGGDFGTLCANGFSGGICQDRVATNATPTTYKCGVGDNTNGCVIANQLYDPASIPANCARTGSGANCPQPTAFANNVIPITSINAVAKALFNSAFYPAPTNGNATNNLTYQQAQAFNADQGDIKVDYVASDKERLCGRFSRAFQTDPTTNTLQIIGNGFGQAPIWNTVVDWNRSLRPTLINDMRFGWNHVTLHNGGAFDPSVGTLGETLGIPGSNPNGSVGLLGIGFYGGSPSGLGTGSVSNVGNTLNEQNFNDQVYQFDEAVVWSHNKHSLHFGFQYWKQIIDTFYSGNSGKLGGIAFSNTFTADPTNAGGSTGSGLADFFLGLPTNFGRGVSSGGWIQSSKTFAGYAQDDWRVTDRLTLNLGLRYEAHTPWVEASDRQVNFGLLSGAVE